MADQHTPQGPIFQTSVPFRPRRTSATPSQRPKTSSGEIEPRSDFLRDALREKKGLPTRSQSTTPRRARVGLRSTAYHSAHDEWMPSSDEERNVLRRSTSRLHKPRRASDFGSSKSLPSQNAMLGQKETGNKLDKLEKDNFDLKLKITMQQERMNQLHEELEQAVSSARDLNNAVELLSKNIASTEEELERTRAANQEMAEINDELMKELEQRDEGIKLRQLAIEEAAGIIQTLEVKCEKLELAASRPEASPRPGSDYFSENAEGTPPKRNGSLRPPMNPMHLGVLPTPPDSDYFSADTSPNITPRTPRFAPADKAAQLVRAQEKGAQFNKELGLRSAASKDSLLSSFIDTPSLPPAPARLLRRKSPTPGFWQSPRAPLQRSTTTVEFNRQETPPWSDSRQLRTLFAQGEFNRRIHASTPLRHTSTTPSVTVGSASTSTEDLFSSSQSLSSRPTTAVSDPTAASSQKLQPQARNLTPLSMPQQQQQQHQITPARTPVNYNNWPRKYPEWPPSLGLRDRDILFHGDGMAEMFPVSTPRVETPQPHSSVSHLRSSSATPTEALGMPPSAHSRSGSVAVNTPQSAPAGAVKRGFSHRISASFSGGKHLGLERRNTTLR
jgi:hypothetical protein